MKSRRSQTGATLVEVLIALALVGILVLALASGMLTLIKTSTETTKRQQVELALGSFTESLKSGPYTKCAVLVPCIQCGGGDLGEPIPSAHHSRAFEGKVQCDARHLYPGAARDLQRYIGSRSGRHDY